MIFQRLLLTWCSASALWVTAVRAANPIVPGVGLTDPHIVIYGDRAYLYGTHDFAPTNKDFVMEDWWVWSSKDLVNWEQVGVLKPEDTFLKKPFASCWATFGASRNGKYYWYFSAGPTEIGVVEADAPTGPWRDPLGKPLIPKGLTPTEQRDPDILIDDDGTAYMVYGTFKYFVVRLGDDMISLAETPRQLKLDRLMGPYGKGMTDDKPSLHKRNGIYYLSWSSYYATATNVYGPYTYKGTVIDPEQVAPEFRMDDKRHGRLWNDRHGNFFTWHGQWYYTFNDKSLPGRTTYFRDACIAYVHFRDNGDMAPIRLDRTGVGQYDAKAPRIEAEDYFAIEKAVVKERPGGGFEVRGLTNGSTLVYPNIQNLPRKTIIYASLASNHPNRKGTLEIREQSPTGKLLGKIAIPDTGGFEHAQTVSCRLKNREGSASLCLVFKGADEELARLDWISFQKQNS